MSTLQYFRIVGMDTLFMNLMNGVTMNLEIIQGALLTLNERVTARYQLTQYNEYSSYSSKLQKKLNMEMKKICEHLQRIYRYEKQFICWAKNSTFHEQK